MLVAIGLALLAAVPAVARDGFKSGNWDGGAYPINGGPFSHCAMAATYKSGVTVVFYLNKDYVFSVSLHNEQWILEDNKTYPVTYWVDNLPKVQTTSSTARLTNQKSDLLYIQIENQRTFFEQIQRGKTLYISGTSALLSFVLDGTAAALNRLMTCVNISSQGDSNPFQGAPSNPGKNPFISSSVPEAEWTDFVRSLFGDRDLSNLRFLERTNFPKGWESVSLAWKGENLVGGFSVSPAPTTIDVGVSLIIAGDSKSCAGKFGSAKDQKPLPKDIPTTQILTFCLENDQAFFGFYTLIPMKVGGFIRFADYSASRDLAQRTDNAIYRALGRGLGGAPS